MQQVTKYLLAEYQRMSKSGKFSGVLSYMAKEAAPVSQTDLFLASRLLSPNCGLSYL